MPLFGKKKKEVEAPINGPSIAQYKTYTVPGATSGLVFCSLRGKEALVAGALNTRGLVAMSVDGEKLWDFDTGATVYSVATASFGGKTNVIAGSGGKVFAVSDSGEELWQYQMPATKSMLMKGLTGFAGTLRNLEYTVGHDDVYHLVTGKLDGEDVVVAIAGGKYLTEGPQIISSRGEPRGALKAKTLGMERPIQIAGCLLDLSPSGDAIVAMISTKAYGKASMISKDGKVLRDLNVHMDHANKAVQERSGPLSPYSLIPDKFRGKLVAGKFGETSVIVVGTPIHRSVAAVSFDGTQLWNYETARKNDFPAGIYDVAIGSVNSQPVAIVGTMDGAVHLVSGNGSSLYSWKYENPVTNVAYGKIGGKDAIAVGQYTGQIFTYVAEPA